MRGVGAAVPGQVVERSHAEARHYSTLALLGQQFLRHQLLVPQRQLHLKKKQYIIVCVYVFVCVCVCV